MHSTVLSEIQQLLRQQFSLSPLQVEEQASLVDAGIDSLSAIEFMFVLEDRFDVSLAETREGLDTVGDLARLVSHACEAKSAMAS